MDWTEFIATEFHRSTPVLHLRAAIVRHCCRRTKKRHTALPLPTFSETGYGPYAEFLLESYERRTDCRKPASFAVALYCGIGSSSLNALVKAFDKLHMVRGWNSSCTG